MHIAVLGVGLIGGSVARAARDRLGASVAGFDRSTEALSRAVEMGVIERAADGVQDAVSGADVVFVAVPVGALMATTDEALRYASAECVVTDVGSTKRAVVAAFEDPRFVGGHPLAGAETSGVEHARADLFEGATWYLTPTAETSGVLYERLYRLLSGVGARPCAIDAETHDRILASISHLPHVLANVLVASAAATLDEGGERLPATGPSFRDATRVAGAPSAIWTDIYLSNRDALASEIDASIKRLEEVRDALQAADPARLTAWNEAAADDRRRLQQAGMAAGPLIELRAAVPNRPGVVAQLALELGRAGVNIADMALYPAADMSEGVVALWVGGEGDAARAEGLVGNLGFPVARA